MLSLYGILGSSGNVSKPAVPILIMLFTGFIFGLDVLRRLALPLGFLVFMVPLPPAIDSYLGLHLKALSTQWGGAIIALCSIPVNVSGNIIDLGVMQLQVVDACSGMRYILPLLALGVLYAHLFERVRWKQAVCALSTIPLGILFNTLRIGITGVLSDLYGPGVAQGFFHDLSGWVVFVFALIMLFIISRILKLFPTARAYGRQPVVPVAGPPPAPQARGNAMPAFLVSAALLAAVAVLSLSTSALPAMALDGGIEGFPLQIGTWRGTSEPVDPVLVEMSGAEGAFSGRYLDGTGNYLSLYLGYRSTAFLSNENFFHSPTVCIPASGWTEQEVGRRTITGVPYFNDLEVTKMVIEKEGVRQLVYYWFQTKNKATHSKSINRFHLSLHALRRDNTHDLFLRPITPIRSAETVEDAERRLDGFIREMMPVLQQFLKEKQIKV
jgi:exosortase D (VPLPA-CTERM-specific)